MLDSCLSFSFQDAHPLARSTNVKHDRGITGPATPAPDASDEESEAHCPVRATGRSGRSIIGSIPDESDEDSDAHIHKKTRRSAETAYEEDCLDAFPPAAKSFGSKLSLTTSARAFPNKPPCPKMPPTPLTTPNVAFGPRLMATKRPSGPCTEHLQDLLPPRKLEHLCRHSARNPNRFVIGSSVCVNSACRSKRKYGSRRPPICRYWMYGSVHRRSLHQSRWAAYLAATGQTCRQGPQLVCDSSEGEGCSTQIRDARRHYTGYQCASET
jgi:hypothetical protein